MNSADTYSSDSVAGRTLLALRAGAMTSGELDARFPTGHQASVLAKAGLVEASENGWRLTDTGYAACPLRNPASATVTPPSVAPLTRSPAPIGLAAKTAPQPHVRRPENLIHTGGIRMSNPKPTSLTSGIDQVRRLLIATPEGVARKEIIQRTGLSESAVDNAIFKLTKCGDAVRKSYGVIAAVPEGVNVMAARLAKCDVQASALPPVGAQREPDAPVTDEPAATKIDFSIYDDGRLAIIDGDEVFVLPPHAARRLGQFLGRIEIGGWPAHA